MTKLGHHQSMDPETERSVAWLDQRPEVEKVVLSHLRGQSHKRTPGYVHIKDRVSPTVLRLVVYGGKGLREIFVTTPAQKQEAVTRLITDRWPPKNAPKAKINSLGDALQAVKPAPTPAPAMFSSKVEQPLPTGSSAVSGSTANPVRLEDMGTKVSTTLRVELIDVTPELALEYLTCNVDNRDVSRARMLEYAQAMRERRWIAEASSIEFDTDGKLVNGQHQLWAVIEAEVTVRMRVTFGMPPKAREVVDTGRTRNPWDTMAIMHPELRQEGFSSTHVAVFNWLSGVGWRTAGKGMRQRLTYQTLRPMYDLHGEAVLFAVGLKVKSRKGLSAAPLAVVARAWYTQDRDKLRRFVQLVQHGPDAAYHAGENAALLLRDFMTDKPTNSTAGQSELYAKTERALQAFLKGETLRILRRVEHEVFPLPEATAA